MKEETKISKNYVIICAIFVVALLILGISLTYAFFETNISNDFTETKFTTGTFSMDTNLTDASVINASNMTLLNTNEVESKSEKINFTAQAKNNNNAKFNIYLKNITISSNMIDSSFKWQLLADNKVISSGDFSDITKNGKLSTSKTSTDLVKYYDTYYLKKAGNFNGNNEMNFEIRLYLLNSSVDQSSLIDGTFSSSAAIEGYL
mgnify:FL=1